MKREILFVSAAAAFALCACRSSRVSIEGRFVVGDGAQSVYLEQVTPLAQDVVDSARLDPMGDFRFELKEAPRTPALYNVVCSGDRIPLLVTGGDRIRLYSAGSIGRNYTVEGSEESELLGEFYRGYVAGVQRLDEIVAAYTAPGVDPERRRELARDYTREYYRIRRGQLRFIIEHKASIAALYALYQRLPGDTYLFNGDSDVVYYRTVAEALEQSYPESPYLAALRAEIARMDARIDLTSRITETGYPDLELADMYGKRIRLSSLQGKVILLDFWSAALGNSNALNAELKELYDNYARRGFEVYQVSFDTSKPVWISAVQEQSLPWISVNDPRGQASPAMGLYGIGKLPANFLIDRDGTVVARDIYGRTLRERLDELTRPQ